MALALPHQGLAGNLRVSSSRSLASQRSTHTSRCRWLHLACSASHEADAPARRSVLLGIAGAAVAAPLVLATPNASAATKRLPAAELSSFQKRDILAELQKRAQQELKKVLTSADASSCVRLLLNDAGTYDQATKTGGADGSVVLLEELDRPENRDLKPLVEKLRKAKAAIDARRLEGQAPLSWADTIVLAAKVTVEEAWREDKISKAASPEKGAFLADGFGNAISVRLGRADATQPSPPGRLPANDASLEEMQKFFFKLGAKPDQGGEGAFAKKPPFWERQQFLLWPFTQVDPAATEVAMAAANPKFADWKRTYDTSRKTVTRTSYEEDFGATLSTLANLGVKFTPDYYMCDIDVFVPDRY